MKIQYEAGKNGVRILGCTECEGQVEIPETIEGKPVTELAAYAFSGKGNLLTELVLPKTLEKIGAYAFYNCEGFQGLTLKTDNIDLGAGLFTGCKGLKNIDITIIGNGKSCFKELISELFQTLFVTYRDSRGEVLAKLVFPEFFEESVENTPARILMTEVHGCGHRYRYCFSQREFQFQDYDKLFPHIKVQESSGLAARLAFGRLYYPYCLTEKHRNTYWEYLREQPEVIAGILIKDKEFSALSWLANQEKTEQVHLDKMIEGVRGMKEPEGLSILMDAAYERFLAGKTEKKKRRFEL